MLVCNGTGIRSRATLVAVFALLLTVLCVLLLRPDLRQPYGKQVAEQAGRPRDGIPQWVDFFETLRNETRYVQSVKGANPTLVWYGDSITEELRGTSYGKSHKGWEDIPAVYKRLFAQIPSAVWAISGDTAANLLWRIKNGNGPAGLQPVAMVVLIGTNDLSMLLAAEAHDEDAIVATVARSVLAVVSELQRAAPKAGILLMGLLPRGDRLSSDADVFKQPSKYTPLIVRVNEQLQLYAGTHDHVTFLDCGSGLLQSAPEAPDLTAELMPDALHPSAAGTEIWLECAIPALTKLGVPNLHA